MSDALVAVGSGGSSGGGASPPPPVPSLSSLITVDALADLKELLQRQDVRDTLVGISAVEALLSAEQVEHVKAIGTNLKKLVDYFVPGATGGGNPPPAGSPPPSGNTPSDAGPGGNGGMTGTPSHATAAAAHAPSHFVSDFGNMLTPVVKMPVDQLRATVDSQGKAIDKGAAGITDLQTAHAASNARLQALEANYQRLDTAHRGLSDRVVEMGFELGESEEATEALGEAVREAGSPVIVVVEEGENRDRDDAVRKTQARPMRQAGTHARKAQPRKKK